MSEVPRNHTTPPVDFLVGGGEMGDRIREFDWAGTSLGPIESWSPALRTMVRVLVANRFPHILWWGPDYIQFYNDAYRPIPGAKHPHRVLGRPASECWSEIWHVIGPLIDKPYQGGPATWDEDILLEINRHGYFEESHFTIAYSPVPDDTAPGGIGGVLATVHEITEQVISDRRMVALRDLGARAVEAKTADEACAIIAETLARHEKDVPFAVLYLIDSCTNEARLAGVAGATAGEPVSPLRIDLAAPSKDTWPLAEASGDATMRVVEKLSQRFTKVPAGPWLDAPQTAVVIPIPASKPQEVAGFLVVGVSARLRFDEPYRSFLELVRTQVANAIAMARAYDEERQRAEALAAIDRAKTQFFSNVSHEFRTPLTLMLGPVEDLLADRVTELSEYTRDQLDVVHRNSLRLLRLVNTMLEFTRIEAGRVSANYEPVDLASLTADLASSFRSACERVGLQLIVNTPPLDSTSPVFVDREMWERIVLNLVSNAFKFTLKGAIEVSILSTSDHTVSLIVRDTGVGIPVDELPHMFERFHRVQNALARTHEGTGIGLALVQELVKQHGGTITVDSVLNEGSTFTVTIPTGSAHLDRVNADGRPLLAPRSMKDAFVEEALRWLPDPTRPGNELPVMPAIPESVPGALGSRPRVLWADDNADMRQYVRRLLSDRYEVEAVPDGQAALDAARREKPDLVLTDVMMPKLDGFELLREIRATDSLRDVPVIMVSARAGEESRIGGMDAGADDYLVKPFSARELVARVDAHVRMMLLRKEVHQQLRESQQRISETNQELNERVAELERANSEILESRQTAQSLMIDALLAKEKLRDADRRKDEFLATLAHELRNPLAPVRNAVAILDLKGPEDSELQWARDVIDRQMKQMSRLVDDLLDVSRVSRGKMELKRERLELAKVIYGAIEASRPLIEQCAHELSVTLPTEAIYLDADETRLIQVFCNLLNNAAKYSESSGRIAVSAVRADREVIVTVRDSGFGIPLDVLPTVFDMFTQADPTLERSKSGLGVGLTLVKRLIEMHGGTVEARSEGLGKGSEFTVRLPLLPDLPLTAKPTDAEVVLALPEMSHRILIVDDNRDAADTMALMLRIKGNQVETAYDGQEAVRVAGVFRPAIALLDIGLPKLDGYEAAKAIRRAEWGRGIVLVAVTGWGQQEDRRRSSEAGFDYHIVKPVDPADLLHLLATVRPAPLTDADVREQRDVGKRDAKGTPVADPPSAAL